jgi:tetratricopeptide (TPR) repeat protein
LLSGLSMYCHRRIDVAGSLELALRGQAVADKTGSSDDVAIADSMLGAAYYMRGEQRRAQHHLERALQSAPPLRRFNATQYLFDLRTTSLFNLTRSYWFTGNVDRAVGYAKMTVEEAERSDHPIALSRALILTMPLYFWIDDLRQVDKNLSRLEFTAEKHSLMPFRAVALGLKGQYLIRTGHAMDGIEHLRDSLAKLALQRYEMLATDFVAELAVHLAMQGERAEALTLVDESIAIQVKFGRPLHLPALFLAKGLALAWGDMPDIRSVEECLSEAMRLARQQSALSFELRAALELARVWIDGGEVQRAHDLVKPIYRQFSEGFATPDLIVAKKMLEPTGAMSRQAG